MKLSLNRPTLIGLVIALLSALTALAGQPHGFDGYTLPIWELLLQLNLCSGFVFLSVGVLEGVETPMPDLTRPLQLFLAAFVSYGAVCVASAASLPMPFPVQLFLFTLALACLVAGWARLGLSLFRLLDAAE